VLSIVLVVIVAAAAVTTTLLVVGGRTHTIQGALDVGTIERNSGCRLDPLYQGIAKGTEVLITDAGGALLATSALGPGKRAGPYCEFQFTARVPDRDAYRVEIDHRGGVTYSKAYFDFYHWIAGLALRGRTLTWS